MKKPDPVQVFDIDSVDSLESYCYHLAKLIGSIRTLGVLQNKAQKIGIFDDDETHLSKVVTDVIAILFTRINDLFCHCLDRTGISPDEFWAKIYQFATKLAENGKKSTAKKKSNGKKK